MLGRRVQIAALLAATSLALSAACSADKAAGDLGEPGTCEDVVASFSACGGELKGTWLSTQTCPSTTNVNPYQEQCPAAVVRVVEVNFPRPMTFDGSQMNVSAGQIKATMSYEFPLTCTYDATLTGCAGWQTELEAHASQKEVDNEAACQEQAGLCKCTVQTASPDSSPAATVPYKTQGGTLTVGPAGEEQTFNFCSEGDTLVLQPTSGLLQSFIQFAVLKRQ